MLFLLLLLHGDGGGAASVRVELVRFFEVDVFFILSQVGVAFNPCLLVISVLVGTVHVAHPGHGDSIRIRLLLAHSVWRHRNRQSRGGSMQMLRRHRKRRQVRSLVLLVPPLPTPSRADQTRRVLILVKSGKVVMQGMATIWWRRLLHNTSRQVRCARVRDHPLRRVLTPSRPALEVNMAQIVRFGLREAVRSVGEDRVVFRTCVSGFLLRVCSISKVIPHVPARSFQLDVSVLDGYH